MIGVPDRVSLKRKLYRAIDGVSPSVAVDVGHVAPIFAGPTVEEWVWVANQSLLFLGEESAQATDVDLVVRDAEGTVVHRRTERVLPDSFMRVNVGRYLADGGPGDSDGTISVGTVEITRKSPAGGYRGTTRPQIELVTANSHCAVHTQGAVARGRPWSFIAAWHPDDDRLFFVLTNRQSHSVEAEVGIAVPGRAGQPLATHTIQIPARGARVLEIQLDPASAGQLTNGLVEIRYNMPGIGHADLICASHDLTRLSIDHE